jgi:hypothetical protein
VAREGELAALAAFDRRENAGNEAKYPLCQGFLSLSFVEALQNHQISPEAVDSETPLGVTMRLAGPSVDFIIGRIFESAMSDAYDAVVKQKDGLPLPVDDWVQNKELKKSIAKQKHHKGNCELIR